MQDEASIGLHRAAVKHVVLRQPVHGVFGNVDFQLLEQFLHGDAGRAIDDHAHRAVFVVFEQPGDCLVEIRVIELRHGDQQLVAQEGGVVRHVSHPRTTQPGVRRTSRCG